MFSPSGRAKKRPIIAGVLALSLCAAPFLPLAANAAITTDLSPSQPAASTLKLSRITPIPFSTQVIDNPELPIDVEVVMEEGVAGTMHIYTTPGYSDSEIAQHRSVVASRPVDRVIHRGTAIEVPIAAEPEPEPEPVVEEVERSSDRQESPVEVTYAEPAESLPTSAEYTLSQFLVQGVVNWGGYKFTYYSQSVLPGGGLSIPGRHVNAGGYVSDGDGYIVLAGSAPKGTVCSTPFGWPGKIYDRGTVGNHLDVYVQ